MLIHVLFFSGHGTSQLHHSGVGFYAIDTTSGRMLDLQDSPSIIAWLAIIKLLGQEGVSTFDRPLKVMAQNLM